MVGIVVIWILVWGGAYELPISQLPISGLLGISIGSGGGGNVDLGSGLFYHPEVGVVVHLTHQFNINLLGGYLAGFSNRYHLKTFLLGLSYQFSLLSSDTKPLSLEKISSHHLFLSIGNETYIDAQNAQDPNHAIQLVSIKLSGMLTKHWFATGESSFAYTGHIPGFATGLIGAGYKLYNKKTSFYAKFLLGAAGGGGIDAKGGFVIKPTIGVGYKMRKDLGMYAQISKLQAIHGNFSPMTLGIGLVYHLNLLGY